MIEEVGRTIQRNILIQEYCGENFNTINLVDFYYKDTSHNAILMFLFICAIYPILFMCVAEIADKYLATGMQDLSERFNLSPTLAAVTLIAFANGSPDILSSQSASSKADGPLISCGALFGSFVFAATLVISNVIWSSKKIITFPKLAISKELFFYALSVFIVSTFGIIGKAGYPFIAVYLSVYCCYIAATLFVEKKQNKQ